MALTSKKFESIFAKQIGKRERAAGPHRVTAEAMSCTHSWDNSGTAGLQCQICGFETKERSWTCNIGCGVQLCGSCMWRWKEKVNPDAAGASGPPKPLTLQRQESATTVKKISAALSKVCPTLSDTEVGSEVLAEAFCAYAADRKLETKCHWFALLLEVLCDFDVKLDDEDNAAAAKGVVDQLVEKRVLDPVERPRE